MKKIIFSAIAIIAFSISFAQSKKDTCPCPIVNPVPIAQEVFPQPQYIPAPPRWYPPAPVVEKKIYITPKQPTNSNVNSLNHTMTGSNNTTTTNNNYFGYGYKPAGTGYVYHNGSDWSWLFPWLCLGLLVWAILWYLNKDKIHTLSEKTSGGGGMKIDIVNQMPEMPKNQVVVPATAEEIDKAMNVVKETGGTFTKDGSGGYTVSFLKPEPAKKEVKSEADEVKGEKSSDQSSVQ